VLTQVGGPPKVLRNDQALGHRHLRIMLVGDGVKTSRDAIGTRVRCTFDSGRVVRRQVMPTRSYLSQVERAVTIGMGTDESVRTLTVTWPDGVIDDHAPDEIDPSGLWTIRRH